MKKFLLFVGWLFVTLGSHPAWSASAIKIMILGDSLSVGYGLPPNSGWVDLLRQRLLTQSSVYEVINISISGEITLGGRKRIEQALATHNPAIVVIALGGNDGLQGRSIQSIYDNLETIVLTCKQHYAVPLLVGIQLPPNYGISYTRKFRDIFPRLAQHHQLKIVPFMLEGFGEHREFFLADGIHPNELAQEKIMENIWPTLASLLESMQTLVEYQKSNIKTKSIPD